MSIYVRLYCYCKEHNNQILTELDLHMQRPFLFLMDSPFIVLIYLFDLFETSSVKFSVNNLINPKYFITIIKLFSVSYKLSFHAFNLRNYPD